MEQKINIAELLKDAPKGTKLYSPICGEVTLKGATSDFINVCLVFEHRVQLETFDPYGYWYGFRGDKSYEPLLFPSKDCRSWKNFKAPWMQKHFEPYQKVLINRCGTWVPELYGYRKMLGEVVNHVTISGTCVLNSAIIPYEGNEDKRGKKVDSND